MDKNQYVQDMMQKYREHGESSIDIGVTNFNGTQVVVQRRFRSRINTSILKGAKTEIVYIEKGVEAADFYSFKQSCANLVIRALGDELKTIRLENTGYNLIFGSVKLEIPVHQIKHLRFLYLDKIISIDLSEFNMEGLTSCKEMFARCRGLKSIEYGNQKAPNVTSFNEAFNACHSMDEIDLKPFISSKATDMTEMFSECIALKHIKGIDKFNTSNATTMEHMFFNCKSLTKLDLTSFDTSKVTNMHAMFARCSNLSQLNISTFNTSRVENMVGMFGFCTSLTELNLGNFDTGNVVYFNNMFFSASQLKRINLSSFNTSKAQVLLGMFSSCKSLERLDLKHFDFSHALDISAIFSDSINLDDIGITQIRVPEICKTEGVFRENVKGKIKLSEKVQIIKEGVSSPEYEDSERIISEKEKIVAEAKDKYLSIEGGKNIRIKVEVNRKTKESYIWQNGFRTIITKHTFRDEEGFRDLDTQVVYIESEVEVADLRRFIPKCPNVIIKSTGSSIKHIWFGSRSIDETEELHDVVQCLKLDVPVSDIKSLAVSGMPKLVYLDLKDFNIEKLTSIRCAARRIDFGNYISHNLTTISFSHCSIEEIDLSCFDTSNITDMSAMFFCCPKLKRIKGIEKFNTSNVVSMAKMFAGCKSLQTLDLTSFDTHNVTDMCEMFKDCSSLQELDITSFDTSNVTTMAQMFSLCESLYNLNILTLNTSNVTDMSEMFRGCRTVQKLDVSSFDTHNVTDMRLMFGECLALKYLDLSKFDTKQVNTFHSMFFKCYALESIDLSHFNVSNCTNMSAMFAGCKKLTTLDLGSFNTSNCTNMHQMFDHCEKLNTLNLSSFDTRRCTNMTMMFRGCHELRTLNLSRFNFLAVKSAENFVGDCPNLVDIGTTTIKISKGCKTNGEKFIIPGVNFIVTPGHIRSNENYKPIERLLEGAPVFETVKIIRES